MADQTKDTVYIDVDDEITTIVDKVQNSSAKVVALVLPKRAASMQSIVNMKLLKRAAEDNGKTTVLITSDNNLLPLAGAVGMYTAKNLQSKPEIPSGPVTAPEDEEVAEVTDEPAETAGADDSVQIKDSSAKSSKPKKSKKQKGDKKPKVPNFEKFRLKLILGILGVLALIGLWYLAVFVAPSAKVIIQGDSEEINTSVEFIARPSATEANIEDKIIPATVAETDKEESQSAPATGEKDIGKKATGSVSMSATKCSGNPFVPPSSVASGTSLSLDGRTYKTGNSVSFVGTGTDSNGCFTYAGNKDAGITAQENGSEYNTGSANFSVSGRSDVSASGSASGGSSQIIKVVSQQDVDNAKGKLSISDDAVKSELSEELSGDNLYAIDATFTKNNEKTSVNPAVGQEGNEVKVTYSADFELTGVSEEGLNKLLKQSISDQINTDQQAIINNGLGQATFTVENVAADGSMTIDVSTVVTVGPDIDQEQLKSEITGKKSGESENIVKNYEGVNEAYVELSPFWVSRVPKNLDKITIEIQDAQPETE